MSLLTIIQRACSDIGIASPNSVVGSTDDQIIQLLSIANREGEDLASRYEWSALMASTTWTISLAADQGVINSDIVTTGDFDSIIPQTMWNRTTTLPIIGSPTKPTWQALQAIPTTGPYQLYKIEGGRIYLDPVPTSADTGAFAYKSTSWCESAGGTGQSLWAADSDTGRLDENLMSLGIVWRWFKRKGLDYAEDFATYESRLADKMARDGGKAKIYLNTPECGPVPGVGIRLWSPIPP